MIIDKCNRCGKIIMYDDRHVVTCKYITFWEHDTTRYLCGKCYKKFQKYMEKNYNKFFTFKSWENSYMNVVESEDKK